MTQNTNSDRPAEMLKDELAKRFGDIQWCAMYPDGSYAIGLKMVAFHASNPLFEVYSRAKAKARSLVMRDMGYEIIDAGYMKPRNIATSGPVVIFRIPEEGVVLE